ncbi:MAG: esterase-like activity of phytase family protein [Bdellovibrionota bacterium]
MGQTISAQSINVGGFSGLQFIAAESTGDVLYFWTVTDRGPNGEPMESPIINEKVRPFLTPDYVPRIYKLRLNRKTSQLSVVEEILLKDPQGKVLSGLPNLPGADEIPSDEKGQPIEYDLMGIDPEGIVKDDAGNFWICDEYRPSLLKFDSTGKLLKKFVPKGSYSRADLRKISQTRGHVEIIEAFPEDLNFRRKNRGFEGLTIKGNNLIVAMQGPLRLPEGKRKHLVRFYEFDPRLEKPVATYLYPIEKEGSDRIGDISWNESGLFVIEQNNKMGFEGVHQVYLVTDLVPYEKLRLTDQPETLKRDILEPVILMKDLRIDLVKQGFDKFEKVEGIAIISDGSVVVATDNDFGVTLDESKNPPVIHVNPEDRPVIGIFPPGKLN